MKKNFRKKNFPESHRINPLLTTLVWSRWLDVGLVFFFFASLWTSTPSRSINQYPAILTSLFVNNPYRELHFNLWMISIIGSEIQSYHCMVSVLFLDSTTILDSVLSFQVLTKMYVTLGSLAKHVSGK